MYSILPKNRENQGYRHDELKILSDNFQVRSLGYGGHSFNGFEVNLLISFFARSHLNTPLPPPVWIGLNLMSLLCNISYNYSLKHCTAQLMS